MLNPKPISYLEPCDWLIILDACRYDFFVKLWNKGRTEPRLSLGSCTMETLNQMPRIPDSILITGHPFPLRMKDKFTEIIDVGFDFNLSTSPPHYITNYLKNNLTYVNQFKRKILWFLQPHHPYIGETKLDVRIYEDAETGKMTPEEKTQQLLMKAKQEGILEKAYEDNLKLVLSEIEKILPMIRGRIIITSDHGEGLGKPLRPKDQPIFSHPPEREEYEVRLIPYCIIDKPTCIELSWDGYKFWIRTNLDRDALRKHELTVIEFAEKLGDKTKVFVDVGANVGMYSIRMAKHYGKVIAIEPEPSNIECLKKNIKLNKINNVTIMPIACSDRTGKALIKRKHVFSQITTEKEGKDTIEVKIDRLDNIVNRCDVIKIDVEGHEDKVVYGAEKLIEKCKPIFIIEHHEYRGFQTSGTREKIMQYLKPYYCPVNLNQAQWIYIPKDDDLTKYRQAIANHWLFKCIENVKNGNAWYYGLPYNWWHGMSILDFYKELPNHITQETEWIKKLLQ